jgi:glyoxylase-like metal-dependent hydrolase (beta-lactamase superfamily II)
MQVTESVFQLDAAKRSHVFLIKTEQVFLIDTGMPGLTGQILSELKSLGVSSGDIRAILLTHHDVDHIGNAKQLQGATGAELWAPAEDASYIVNERKRPGIKHMIETIIKPQRPDITGTYDTNWLYNKIHVLHAPGHTPGHTIFQFQNVVFTGDLFKFIKGRFRLFPEYMNWNQAEAENSLSLLKALTFDCLCPSHGDPVRSGPELQAFLNRFNPNNNHDRTDDGQKPPDG